MSHITPTLRSALHATYTTPAMRRKPVVSPGSAASSGASDFQTVLNNQSPPVVTATVLPTAPATPASILPSLTTSTAATIGTPASLPPPMTLPTAAPATAATVPTAQALFGDSPWVANAGGAGPHGAYSYNPIYFATPATAAKVAQMLGGTVVGANAITPYGPFVQNQQNLMVQLPDGKMINPGLIADLYNHGYTQNTVDGMVAAAVAA